MYTAYHIIYNEGRGGYTRGCTRADARCADTRAERRARRDVTRATRVSTHRVSTRVHRVHTRVYPIHARAHTSVNTHHVP